MPGDEQRKTKPGEKMKTKACPFLSKRRRAMLEIKEAALAAPMDIEDLVRLGETRRACPYYAARSALPEADLVLMPYASLLHADTREILGIKLENAVVIFDEALATWWTPCTVRSDGDSGAVARRRRNADRVRRSLQDSIECEQPAVSQDAREHHSSVHEARYAKESADDSKPEKRLTSLNDFLFECGQDTVNMFSLRKYLKESKVAHKVRRMGSAFARETRASTRAWKP